MKLQERRKLHMEAQICDWEAIEKQKDWLPKLGVKKDFVTPWVLLALEDNPARQRKRSERRVLAQRFHGWIGDHRLRIGYFSADFHYFSWHVFNGSMTEIISRSSLFLMGQIQ